MTDTHRARGPRLARDTSFPMAERLIDHLAPEELDWRGLAQDYPILSLGAAAIGGFYLGWAHGDRILEALSDVAARRVNDTVDRYVDFGPKR